MNVLVLRQNWAMGVKRDKRIFGETHKNGMWTLAVRLQTDGALPDSGHTQGFREPSWAE